MGKRRNQRNKHLFNFVLFPVHVHLLALSEHVLQVLTMLDELGHNGNAERVIHRLVEIVTVELDDVRMALGFEKLDGFFLVLVKLV